MLERIERYLQETCMIPALSGHEQKMAAYFKKEMGKLEIDVIEDTMGNCIGKIPGEDPDAPVIMIFSHLDSLGFMVKYIEEDGFLRVERVGGVPEKVLPSTEIVVGCRDGSYVNGVFGVKDHHVTPPEEKYVVGKYPTQYIDIGASSREEVLALGIDIGSPIVYKPKYQKMLNHRAYMSFCDNRGGISTILELANILTASSRPSTVYLVGSVQEEYNLRGAMVASRSIHPDVAICIDGGMCSDTPDSRGTGMHVCGGGPIMSLFDFHGRGTLNGTIAHPAMVRLFEQASQRTHVPLQRATSVGSLTDLSYVQLENTGVKSLNIYFPGRYAHSPCEMVDLCDLDATARLIAEVVDSINAQTDFSR